MPAGDNLVIGSVAGDPTVVVRDIQDPANAKNLCTFDPAAQAPQFVSAAAVAYETPDNQIVKADLAAGATTVIATYAAGAGSGQYAISPDGSSVTYLDGNAWHLARPSGNRVLSTLPAVPGRGTNPDEDDSFLSYSPDGQYIALFQTYHTGGSGETAADQVRRAGDGTLAYSTTGMTMAVWASVPSRLFFRDASGSMHRWDPSSGALVDDGHPLDPAPFVPRWPLDRLHVPNNGWRGRRGFLQRAGQHHFEHVPPGRSGVRFLNNDLVWYIGERACSTCLGGAPTPTGVAYIYDIAGASEITARLADCRTHGRTTRHRARRSPSSTASSSLESPRARAKGRPPRRRGR